MLERLRAHGRLPPKDPPPIDGPKFAVDPAAPPEEFRGAYRAQAEFASVYDDLALLAEYPGLAFKGLPFKSSAVEYRAWGKTSSRRLGGAVGGGRRVVDLARATWTARPATPALASAILREERVDPGDLAQRHNALDAHLPVKSLGLRLGLLGASLAQLCGALDARTDPLFAWDDVVELEDAEILELARRARADPFSLCFRDTHGFPGIPDLSFAAFCALRAPEPWQRAVVDFYEALKRESYEAGNTVARGSALPRDPRAIEWLAIRDIVRRPAPDLYCLARLDEAEECLALAVAHLFEAGAGLELPPLPEDARTAGGHPLCPEQRAFVDAHRATPVVILDGAGGSGKTSALAALKHYWAPDRMLGVAFMGGAAADLARVLAIEGSTLHRLLYQHAKDCNGASRCAFAAKEVMIVEEAYTAGLELLSRAFAAFASCARAPKRVVLLGDSGQLPPIRNPSPTPTLAACLGDALPRFVHNHRTQRKALTRSQRAIARGDLARVTWNAREFALVLPEASESVDDALLRELTKRGLRPADHVVLTMRNDARLRLNPKLEERLGRPAARPRGIHVGQKFVFTKNRYAAAGSGALEIANNEVLVLTGITDRPRPEARRASGVAFRRMPARRDNTQDRLEPGATREVRVATLKGEERVIEWDEWCKHHHKKGAALTVNAMQGKEASNVFYVVDRDSPHENRKRLYTAASRAQEFFAFVGQYAHFKAALTREEPPTLDYLRERLEAAFAAASGGSGAGEKRKRE